MADQKELREEVSEALQTDPRTQKSVIGVAVEGGAVTLTGTVADAEESQVAQAIAEDVEGVVEVINDLHIAQPDRSGDEPGTDEGVAKKVKSG